jgi:quinol monooxygenase YgiN
VEILLGEVLASGDVVQYWCDAIEERLLRLDAKPGKEKEVADFLRGGLAIVQEEPATTAWFAIQLGPSTFGIFDAFPDDAGRQAHLQGRVAAALMAKAPEFLAKPPSIEKVSVLAAKLP